MRGTTSRFDLASWCQRGVTIREASGSARFTGEADYKGVLRLGSYGDPAILSEDYFQVDERDIARIDSLLTAVGGRVVYAVGEYAGMEESLQAISPEWSPVSGFGGFHVDPPGVRQAEGVLDVAASSSEHRAWRSARGAQTSPSPSLDPCLEP